MKLLQFHGHSFLKYSFLLNPNWAVSNLHKVPEQRSEHWLKPLYKPSEYKQFGKVCKSCWKQPLQVKVQIFHSHKVYDLKDPEILLHVRFKPLVNLEEIYRCKQTNLSKIKTFILSTHRRHVIKAKQPKIWTNYLSCSVSSLPSLAGLCPECCKESDSELHIILITQVLFLKQSWNLD